MRLFPKISLALSIAAASATAAHAVDYGTLKGTFTIAGMTPTMKKIVPTKDVAVCGKHELHEEELVVGKGGGLVNAVIYALGDPSDFNKPVANIHESYAKLKTEPAVLDNKGCRFEPRLAIVWTEQKFKIKNSDPGIGHNSFGQPFVNSAFNPLIPAGGSVDVPLDKPEKLPFKVACSIHPWMGSYVLVRPDPYATASGDNGGFEIANIPAGEHTFQLWHETLGYLKKVNIDGKAQAERRGQYKITVKQGDNEIKIALDAKDYKTQIDKIK
ncbi:MAG: hypothetical protein WD875_09585 [Pirellulales bacterium]